MGKLRVLLNPVAMGMYCSGFLSVMLVHFNSVSFNLIHPIAQLILQVFVGPRDKEVPRVAGEAKCKQTMKAPCNHNAM